MRAHCIWLITLTLMTTPAFAQSDEEEAINLNPVWFTSYECPDTNDTGPGSRAAPLELEDFGDPYYASSLDDETESVGEDHARYHCRWVRLTGFMTWFDYYHYRGTLNESFGMEYFVGDKPRYILERFEEGTPPRAELAQRRLTLVGRFYNLCFAAEEARRASGDSFWWLFGPCHYGMNNGMMLTDIQVEAIHDPAPIYLLGDVNRAPLNLAPLVEEGADRTAMEAQVRAWAGLLRGGLEAYADAIMTSQPYLASASEEERQEVRANIVSADSYASYLTRDIRFRRMNVRRAQVEIFWDEERRGNAYGCICLERSCADRWPLFPRDADEFLGDAACIELDREANGAWRWD